MGPEDFGFGACPFTYTSLKVENPIKQSELGKDNV
jgi:hypothetical protein